MPPSEDRSHHPLATALFVAIIAFFAPSLEAYAEVWSAQPYTHGWLIALATVWLVWREREVFRTVSPWPAALLPVAVLSLLWLVATVAEARVVALAMVPALLLAWSSALYGKNATLKLAPAAATFLLAVPIWGVLVTPLQRLTVVISGGLAHAMDIPAEIDGDLIHIEYGTFLVAGGCAGLNYLMSGLTVGALYALGFLRSWPARVAVLALSALAPIVGNWVRVAALIALGHYTRMESIFITQPRPHLWFGWGIFLIGLLVFFPLAGAVERRLTRRWPGRPDLAPLPDVADRPPAPGQRRFAVRASVAALVGPLLYLSLGSLPVHASPRFTLDGPSGSWRSVSPPVARPYGWEPAFAGAQEHRLLSWTNGADSVLLDHLIYHEQRQGAELIGYESRIAPDSLIAARRLFGPLGTRRRVVNEVIVRDGDAHVLVWYWYRVAGVEAVEPLRAKLLEVWAFFSRRTAAELIAVSTACAPDTCADASRALLHFMGES